MSGPLLSQRALLLVLMAVLAVVGSGCQGLRAAVLPELGSEMSAQAVEEPSPTDPATATAEPTSTPMPTAEAPPTATPALVPTSTPSPTTEPTSAASSELPTGPVIGALAPDLTLVDLSGIEVTLSDLRGKAVLLNFWTTW